MKIGEWEVKQGNTYIIAEIGINHNGDEDTVKRLIHAAKDAGANAVKFQKRQPYKCVPEDQWDVIKQTPWGDMRYIDYKVKMELSSAMYDMIDRECSEVGIDWSASVWDIESARFIAEYAPPFVKIPSACVTDLDLIKEVAGHRVPLVISLGGTTYKQYDAVLEKLADINAHCSVALMHCNSSYPAKVDELNLEFIRNLSRDVDAANEGYPNPWFVVGYSGHETGLATTVAAVALGACVIERHITLDRSMWGTDQAASVEPQGFARLVRDIRTVEKALGDGMWRVYDSEKEVMKKLRRV